MNKWRQQQYENYQKSLEPSYPWKYSANIEVCVKVPTFGEVVFNGYVDAFKEEEKADPMYHDWSCFIAHCAVQGMSDEEVHNSEIFDNYGMLILDRLEEGKYEWVKEKS